MKFGLHYQLPCHDSQSPVQRYRETLEQATHAETLGFESVWPVEQHFDPDLSILPAPLLLLAALAERTTTLRLGIAIILLPLSHPVRVAEEIATLDVLSGGRVEQRAPHGGHSPARTRSIARRFHCPSCFTNVWTRPGSISRSFIRPLGCSPYTSTIRK